MSDKSSVTSLKFIKVLLAATLLLVMTFASSMANELPLAAGSPLAGFAFDDRPLLLPVQRNFQMAMLTASSELGRSCGKMEAYGWRMDQSEQGRVNQIFNNTVDRMRALGYEVQSQAPTSVSRDITMFTADRSDRHFLIMWSAGEIGLVMVLCQTTAPMGKSYAAAHAALQQPSVQVFAQPEVVQTKLPERPKHNPHDTFSPVGDWVGSYSCAQGYTGGTLQISHLNGENFEGSFHFYATSKNPGEPDGRYTVYGQYDSESHRILINPGKWLERPKDFYNTVMIGSFDPATMTFSAYFQGITGCTSFEAHYVGSYKGVTVKGTAKKKVAKSKKASTKNAPAVAVPAAAVPSVPPSPDAGTPPSAPAATPAPPASVSPAQPAPAPAATEAPTPITPPPAPTPSAAPAAPKGTSLDPDSLNPPAKKIVVASGEVFTPTVPQAPKAQIINPVPDTAPTANIVNTIAPQAVQPNIAPQASITNPIPTQAPQPNYVAPPAYLNPVAVQVPQPNYVTPPTPTVPNPDKVPQINFVKVPPGPQTPPY